MELKMNKNKCYAYTREKIRCENYATNDSDFCDYHKKLFKDFPPVKIFALMCPYCDKPVERNAEFCSLCKNFFLICPYCDTPLRKDDKFCRFCKEALTTAINKPDNQIYFDKLVNIFNDTFVDIRNRYSAKRINIGHGFLLLLIFSFMASIFIFYIIDIYLNSTQ